jgi:excisionase family DNA binding protein
VWYGHARDILNQLLFHYRTAGVIAPGGRVILPHNARLNGVKDIVARTGLSRSKIYQEMASGHLLSVKVGSRRLIPESALIDYIDRLIESATSGGARAAIETSTVEREKAAV